MMPTRRPLMVTGAWFLVVTTAARAQPSGPRIGYVYPAGGRQGSSFQVTVGGQFLEGVAEARVSGTGVTTTVVEHNKPLTPQKASELRDQAKELMQKKAAANRGRSSTRPAWTAEDEKKLAEIQKKLANFVRRPPTPAIAETVTVQVTIAANAAPGERELRLRTPAGLTNPLVFCVGQLPEVHEEEREAPGPPGKDGRSPKPDRPTQRPRPDGPGTRAGQDAAPMTVTPPVVVNGQIFPGDVDRFRFSARKGDRLVVAVAARQLVPYLADAVPGWFQAVAAIYDAQGHELAYDDDWRFQPDPVVYCTIPADGEYVLEIRDALYRGREDFVYRIALGELPFVTGVFPLGASPGARVAIELRGWNLPASTLTPAFESPGIYPLSVRRGAWVSNHVPFAVDALPECREHEPNDSAEKAQVLTLPVIVNGRIGRPGDRDIFRIDGRAGDRLVAEVRARRLDSPLDSVLRLTDAGGREIAFNDDHEDKAAGLTTHHADSHVLVSLPASGACYLHLSDAQDKGGPEYAYRLRVSRPQPDFEVRVVPSALNVRAGGTVPLTAYALRKDGYEGPIDLALVDPPPGFTLSGARIPPGQEQVRLTLTVAREAGSQPLPLTLEGRATIDGRPVVRRAVPADDMMQAFAYRHLVPAKELLVAVSGRWPQRNPVRIVSPTPVKIPAGGTARVQVDSAALRFARDIRLELSEPPEGIAIQDVLPARDGTQIVLQGEAGKVKPGQQGNLIIQAYAERPSGPGGGKPQAQRKMPVGVLPAVPFEIVPN